MNLIKSLLAVTYFFTTNRGLNLEQVQYRIFTNQKLCEDWSKLGAHFEELGSICEKEEVYTREEITEWYNKVNKVIREKRSTLTKNKVDKILFLRDQTIRYLTKIEEFKQYA